MNSQNRCVKCKKNFLTRKDFTDHNANERKAGRVTGHEIQSRVSSHMGSRIGMGIYKMEDVDGKFLPNHIFTEPTKQATSEELGFKLNENASKSMFNYPTVNTACQEKRAITLSASTAEDILDIKLKSTREWEAVQQLCQSEDFSDMPKDINKNYALSFLAQTQEMEAYDPTFLPAFIRSISRLGVSKLSALTYQAFIPFLKTFRPDEAHTPADLTVLFEFTKAVGSYWEWLSYTQYRAAIITTYADTCTTKEASELAESFSSQFALHSPGFFVTYDKIMSLPSLQKSFLPHVDAFFEFLTDGTDRCTSFDLILDYKKLSTAYQDCDVNTTAKQVRASTTQHIADQDVISLVRLVFKHGWPLIHHQLQKRQPGESIEDFVARLEDGLDEKQKRQAFTQEKEMMKEQLKKTEQEKKIEDEKRATQQKEEDEVREQQLQAAFLGVYHTFCDSNTRAHKDQDFLEFLEQMLVIAKEIKVTPRSEQLAVMFLLLTSTKPRSLIQLVTGFGKSCMLGLMASYLNIIKGRKTVVVVPNEVLAAIQEKYSPLSSKDIGNLFLANTVINYCTYSDFLSGNIPLDTVILVDEIDSIFFSDAPLISGGKLLSAILLLNKYHVIGMTATLRGERGANMMKRFLKDSVVLQTGTAVVERVLALDVYGKVAAGEIDTKIIEVAKVKQVELPLIVILPSLVKCQEMEQHFEHCYIFGVGRVPIQLGCLQLIQAQQTPWPIVLTTAEASLGHDITPTAYVIQTEIPSSYSVFVQNAGRSNRVNPAAALIGALVTTDPILSIDAVKQGCEYEQQRQKLFSPDYLLCLGYLEACASISTQFATFTNALQLFCHSDASAVTVHTALSKYQKFKAVLPPPPKPEFAVPAPLNMKIQPVLKKQIITESPSPLKKQRTDSSIAGYFKAIVPPKRIEEKTTAGCFWNHRADMVSDSVGLFCKMCKKDTLVDGSFKCSICVDAHYCKNCGNASERAFNIGDSEDHSSLMDQEESLISNQNVEMSEMTMRNFEKDSEKKKLEELLKKYPQKEKK